MSTANDDFCYLTTTGRRTGRPHEIEIWFALHGTTAYLLSGSGDASDWVRNLVARPEVTILLGEVEHPGTARVLARDSDEDALARRLVFDKYQPRYSDDLDDWREQTTAVAIDLDGPP